MTDEDDRETWTEGPDAEAPPESWLSLDDDALLMKIETLDSAEEEDERLIEVVASDRHFFVRQEAAKRIKDRRRLYAFEDDRHIGQIFVRHLSRQEDLTYLERISMMSRHVEVRQAAQVQLARVWQRLERSHPPRDTRPMPRVVPPGGGSAVDRQPEAESAASVPPAPAAVGSPLDGEEVDGSLLGWAAHFVVERAWKHLGTKATLELLLKSRGDLESAHPTLAVFYVGQDARVSLDLESGPRVPRSAVRDVAMWLAVFRKAAADVAPEAAQDRVRDCTALMADALRAAGFYTAFEDAEAALSL
ncbi:MAG TPA: hypothetical protein VGB87_01355 [Vicinamibacteria bacterium]